MFAIDRVLDVEQVESLLFWRADTGREGGSIEENYYIVPIG